MDASALVLKAPKAVAIQRLRLAEPCPTDIVVETRWSGISAGTERLLWDGRMPHFPGMGYPLVPGYETVGEVVEAGAESGHRVGDLVFAPGARCFEEAHCLFGGAASRLVLSGERAARLDPEIGENGILMALAATAYHALAGSFAKQPCLIVGHGALGRLLARLSVLLGGEPPVVWEIDQSRIEEGLPYRVVTPEDDPRRDYALIIDVSGDADILDTLVQRLAPGGEVVLAGFYADRLSFAFAPAFMKEARIRAAAEWKQGDLIAVRDLVETGRLSLDGIVTHRADAALAPQAYATAFEARDCLKMALDWRSVQ